MGIVLILAITFLFYNKNVINNQIEDTSIAFTKYLIEGNIKEAETLSVGSVKFNLATNISKDSQFQYLNTKPHIELSNQNIAIVHIETTYKDSGGLNMGFYKMYLIKNQNSYFIYKIEEEDPVIKKKGSMKVKPETIIPVFESYLKAVENQDYMLAGKVLIAKAKKAHVSTSQFLQKTQLVKDISNLKSELIYVGDNQAIVNFTYTNDGRSISTLVYFYNTIEGWRIYDISQL